MSKSFRITMACLTVALLGMSQPVLGGTAEAKKPQDERTEFVKLEVFPNSLELQDIRDSRSLLVTGQAADGLRHDLTTEAELRPAGPQVSIDKDGFIVPEKTGKTEVIVSAAGLQARIPVTVKNASPKPVDFVRDVVPVISKVGCNAGTCHGSREGQEGFKLSLRGYDPHFDYRAFVDDVSGRRFNRSKPSQSLMLLKPTQGVPHGGGFLFDEQSRYYQLIRQWIAEGCRYRDTSRVDRLEVHPEKPLLHNAEDSQQLLVLAHYPDGTVRDVTRDVVYDTSDFEVATVSEDGLIQGVRRGEAAALMRYEGRYASARISIIGDREGFAWKPSPEFNYVDKLVNQKLKRMKILPGTLCTDAEFLRRLSIDLTGVPPTGKEVRAFLEDPRPSQVKRKAKIDELLNSSGYVNRWTLKWSDLLLVNSEFLGEKGMWAFRNWIRHAIATNKPYDQFVRELMTATGSTYDQPATNYFRVAQEPNQVMENMTQVFLGTRFQCNKCHDHPFERWTQDEYYQLSAFFAGVGRKKGPGENERVIYKRRNPQPVKHPSTGEVVEAKFPYRHAGMDPTLDSRRQRLAQWLTSPENPYFATSLVNRYWSYFLGRGLISPVDDIRSSNPPTNPALLEALKKDFVEHGFDLKHLIRTIVSSHTYQRSHLTNEWNAEDTLNYSHAVPRRLTAEQLYDAIKVATGAPTDLPGLPAGFRATQLPDPKMKVSFLSMFGRPPRESPCECERSEKVSLSQTLNLINGPTVSEAIIHPKGLVSRLAEQKVSADKFVEEIYLAVLCRFPTEKEIADGKKYFAEVDDPRQAGEDLMWALINSPAFLFNR